MKRMTKEIESIDLKNLHRATQWCVVAWASILIGVTSFAFFHGFTIRAGGFILTTSGFVFSLITALFALIGILSPGTVARLRFVVLFLLSAVPSDHPTTNLASHP
jgi:hypothetical protein